MVAEDIIDIACSVLKLDKEILTGKRFTKGSYPFKHTVTPQTREYCEGRFIITYLIRKNFSNTKITAVFKHKQAYRYTYQEIALMLGQKLKTGLGDNAASIYSETSCKELLSSKNKEFTQKYTDVEMAILKVKGAEIPDDNFIGRTKLGGE